MIDVEIPNAQMQVVDPDGRLTVQGMLLLQKMAEALKEAQAKIDALENP